MTRFLKKLINHKLAQLIFSLVVVLSGYALALFGTDALTDISAPSALAYASEGSAVIAKPFLRLAGTLDRSEYDGDQSVHIVAVGDIMLDRGVKYIVDKKGSGDEYFPFQHVASIIKDADIAFGNLEGPISDAGANVGSMYSFRMPTGSVQVLENVGFDVLSFANNHVGDWGREAFVDTLSRFSSSRMRLIGAGLTRSEAEQVVVKEINGTRVGFLAFSDVGPHWIRATDTSPGILIASPEDIDRIVRRASPEADILLVSFHFGDEYQTISNSRQRLLAHAAVDAGAHVVIGHHPHVGQEVEEYRGAIIAYSLGNFVFDQRFSDDTSKGLILALEIKDNRIVSFQKKVITFNAYFQPLPTWDISTTTTSNN